MASPRLSIVVPVYNEERTLPEIMKRLVAVCGTFAQIIYVDDGSRDGSLSILHSGARSEDVVLTKSNGGKGSAVRAGFSEATGTYTVIQDADLEYDPAELKNLLEYAERHGVPVVFGSRRLKHQKQYRHLSFFIGGSLITLVHNVLFGTRLTDQPTCYKMVRTDLLRSLPLVQSDFRFEPELSGLLALRHIPIVELPISYHPRSVAEGKKINWRDWFRWMHLMVTLRLRPR